MMYRFLQLRFLPAGYDFGLFVLRLAYGLPLLILHGWTKVIGFGNLAAHFPNPVHIGSGPSLAFTVFTEVVCSILIIVGLFTRLAALFVAVNLGVAFAVVHRYAMSGQHSGELAYLYLTGFIVLFLTGPGRFSVDGKV